MNSPASTPLTAWHHEHDAKMTSFAGYNMPIHYGSIVSEHVACRTRGALFDISHMARLRFDGEQSQELLDHVYLEKSENRSCLIYAFPTPEKAPYSVASFLKYVDQGLYKEAGFYRIVRRDNDNLIFEGRVTAFNVAHDIFALQLADPLSLGEAEVYGDGDRLGLALSANAFAGLDHLLVFALLVAKVIRLNFTITIV